MKGQVSTELLIIIGLVLLIFIPLLVLVYIKAGEANTQIASYQSELAVFRLAYLANSVGSLGTNTSVTTDIFIPEDTVSLGVASVGQGGEISLLLEGSDGPSEIVEVIRYPVEGTVLATGEGAGTWMRVRISSDYEDTSGATIRFERQ